jgi:inorganic pyrophosphatase
MNTNLEALPAIDQETNLLNVVIETPKNCRNKYKFLPNHNAFALAKTLPLGHAFPFDFGFIPFTLGADGDPLDVLLLLDEPVFPGCIVRSHLIAVIEADQTEKDGTVEKNDRLIAVADTSELFHATRKRTDLPPAVLRQIQAFFVSYNQQAGRKFKVTAEQGPKRATQLLDEGIARYRKKHKRRK